MKRWYFVFFVLFMCMNAELEVYACKELSQAKPVIEMVQPYATSNTSQILVGKEGQSLEDLLMTAWSNKISRVNVSIYKYSLYEFYDVYMGILYDHPEMVCASNIISMFTSERGALVEQISISYWQYTEDEVEQVHSAVRSVLESMPKGLTDLEKTLYIHDWLCVNVEYAVEDSDDWKYHSVVGLFTEGKAVCEGYARAYQYFMNELEIPCHIVGNDNHVWNQVELDGKWYMVDVTGDEEEVDRYGKVEHKYFLVSQSHVPKVNSKMKNRKACTSTRFENAFWNTVSTEIIYNNGKWYYLDITNEKQAKLYQQDLTKDRLSKKGKMIQEFLVEQIRVGDSFWNARDIVFVKYGNDFLYNEYNKIYKYDLARKKKECIKTVNKKKGYIVGMKMQGQQLLYQQVTDLQSEDECVTSFDITRVNNIAPKVNTIVLDKKTNMEYIVTSLKKTGGTVAYRKNCNGKKTTVRIPKEILIKGKKYKVTSIAKGAFKNSKVKRVVIPSTVTSIGASAFYNCKKMKTITIQTKKLKGKRIGKNAFKGLNSKVVVKVPKSKNKTYRSLLKKKGLNDTARIKKIK